MNQLVTITINGKTIQVPGHYTVMQAADRMKIDIPRLCYLKDISETAACRICIVDIEGINTLKNSCTVKVAEGMVVKTNTDRVKRAVKE